MLDRRFIRDNPEAVRRLSRVKGIDLDVDELPPGPGPAAELQRELDEAQTWRKHFAKRVRQGRRGDQGQAEGRA